MCPPMGVNNQATVKTSGDGSDYGVDVTKPSAVAPDITDELVRRTRTNELVRLMATRGRKSTFAGGQAQPGPGPVMDGPRTPAKAPALVGLLKGLTKSGKLGGY